MLREEGARMQLAVMTPLRVSTAIVVRIEKGSVVAFLALSWGLRGLLPRPVNASCRSAS